MRSRLQLVRHVFNTCYNYGDDIALADFFAYL